MHFPTYDLITVIDEQLRITRQADRNAHVIAELPDTSDGCRKRCSGSKLNFHSPFSDTFELRARISHFSHHNPRLAPLVFERRM
jgi:hypothetical protein